MHVHVRALFDLPYVDGAHQPRFGVIQDASLFASQFPCAKSPPDIDVGIKQIGEHLLNRFPILSSVKVNDVPLDLH